MCRRKINPIFIYLSVFIIAFIFGLFLTKGLPFFWEDFGRYFDSETGRANTVPLSVILKRYFISLSSPNDFFRIANHWRPLRGIFCAVVPSTAFGTNVEFYHIYKSVFFGLSSLMVFWIIKRMTDIRFATLGLFFYITSRDVFSTLYQIHNEMLHGQMFFLVSVLLFIMYFTRYNNIKPWVRALYFIGILFFLRNAIFVAQDGRYFFVMLLPFLIFQGKAQLKRHGILLLGVFLISFPFLGLLKYLFLDRSFKFIEGENVNLLSNLFIGLKNYSFILNMFTYPILFALLLLVLLGVVSLIRRYQNSKADLRSEYESDRNLLAWMLFAFFWFVITFVMGVANRGLGMPVGEPYTPTTFNRYEFSYCTAPFVIFLSFVSFYVINKFSGRARSVLTKVVFILIAAGIFNQIYWLNQYRGGWGEYFNAWANAGRYIEKNFDNTITFGITSPPYPPFMFLHSKNELVVNPGLDLNYVDEKSQEYMDIFVVTRGKADFINRSDRLKLKEVLIFDGDTNGPYERFKKALGRKFHEEIYLYHFVREAS